MPKERTPTMRGRSNDNHDTKVSFTLTVRTSLLNKVVANITGKNRSEKFINCIELGYIELTHPHGVEPKQ